MQVAWIWGCWRGLHCRCLHCCVPWRGCRRGSPRGEWHHADCQPHPAKQACMDILSRLHVAEVCWQIVCCSSAQQACHALAYKPLVLRAGGALSDTATDSWTVLVGPSPSPQASQEEAWDAWRRCFSLCSQTLVILAAYACHCPVRRAHLCVDVAGQQLSSESLQSKVWMSDQSAYLRAGHIVTRCLWSSNKKRRTA